MLSIIQNSEINIVSGQFSGSEYYSCEIGVGEYIEKLLNAESVNDVRNICAAIRYQYGFDFFVIVSRLYREGKKPLCFVMREFENDWTAHYEENKYIFIDPSIRVASMSSTPYIWSKSEYQSVSDKLFSSERKVLFDALDFGFQEITNIPFHGPNGSYGLIRFVNYENGQNSGHDWVQNPCKLPELYLLSSYIFESIDQILVDQSTDELLSNREKDILQLIALGKNPASIADYFNISEHTVCKHLCNVRVKLKVKSTTHAAAKAVSEKIISI